MRKITCLTFLLGGFAMLVQANGQPVQLSPIRQLRKGVEEWPLILNPRNDAERRINKYLSGLNVQLSHSLKECHANYTQRMGKPHRSANDSDEGVEFWTQGTKVTMTGPTFLSIVAKTSFYCGGAHPYGFTSVAVFDLGTGEPADPLLWFLPTLMASLGEESGEDATLEKSVTSVGLLDAYREATQHQCDQTYPKDQPFLVWPDAKSGKVMIEADRLPGCCEACGIQTGITLDQARKLGFSEMFLQAVSEAHRRLVHR